MVQVCVAIGCTSQSKPGSGVSFYRFPHKKPDLLEKWISAIRRKNWLPTQHSCICSEHFQASCFHDEPNLQGHSLKEGSILSISPALPSYYQQQHTCNQAKVTKKRLPGEPPKKKAVKSVPRPVASPKVSHDHRYVTTHVPEPPSEATKEVLQSVHSLKNQLLPQRTLTPLHILYKFLVWIHTKRWFQDNQPLWSSPKICLKMMMLWQYWLAPLWQRWLPQWNLSCCNPHHQLSQMLPRLLIKSWQFWTNVGSVRFQDCPAQADQRLFCFAKQIRYLSPVWWARPLHSRLQSVQTVMWLPVPKQHQKRTIP